MTPIEELTKLEQEVGRKHTLGPVVEKPVAPTPAAPAATAPASPPPTEPAKSVAEFLRHVEVDLEVAAKKLGME